jgi:hypothetical protein
MINSLFFDSDCLSAFLWVNEQNLLTLLYPGMVVIPKPAYDELSYPTTPHLKQRIDYLISTNQVSLATIGASMLAKRRKLGTASFSEYIQIRNK